MLLRRPLSALLIIGFVTVLMAWNIHTLWSAATTSSSTSSPLSTKRTSKPLSVITTEESDDPVTDAPQFKATTHHQTACSPTYSSFVCRSSSESAWVGNASTYGFTIINRTCVYHNVAWVPAEGGWVYYQAPDTPNADIPFVSLASVPYDLPIMHWKRKRVHKRMDPTMTWRPKVVRGKVPCELISSGSSDDDDDTIISYYSPVVAPWNYAHTLFNDLFSVFWQWYEHGLHTAELRRHKVVLVGTWYASLIPNLQKNNAFKMFSRNPVVYDKHLPSKMYRTLVAGSGTKSWMFFNKESYSAPGSEPLWYAFRRHIMSVTGVTERRANDTTSTRAIKTMVICHKTDKRGLVNYEQTAEYVNSAFNGRIEAKLVQIPKLSAREQVEVMVNADMYLCNEGTLATSFFLLPPGAVFLSVPLVYHSPHLHVKDMERDKTKWWALPDPMRPDPRKQTGGNIDWFPQAIPWVKVLWYAQIPLNETQIQLPLHNLRNYMPDYNVVISRDRVVGLVGKALEWFALGRTHVQVPNFSINAQMCDALFKKHAHLATSFNSARCYFGKSWLCEFLTNTNPGRRFLHPKWQISKGRCGGGVAPDNSGISDPRDDWSMSEYRFYDPQNVNFQFDF
eukprot:PhM_4_TR6636/c0_g1_i1/m.91872